jgi:hypothetical protein
MAFFFGSLALFPANMKLAMDSAAEARARVEAVTRDLASNIALIDFMDRHMGTLMVIDEPATREALTGYMLCLKKHGDSRFQNIRVEEAPFGEQLSLKSGNARGFSLGSGWYDAEENLRWSGPVANVRFWLSEESAKRPLQLVVHGFTLGPQTVDVILNGHEVGRLPATTGTPTSAAIRFPPEVQREYNVLQFRMPRARTPKSMGFGEDARPLGLAVEWMEFISD